MSQEALAQVIERASTDAAFRAQLQSDPDRALAGYELTAEERAALLSGDPGQLQSLGVEQRVSKLDNPPLPGEAQEGAFGPWS
ncbi:MAG TPA: Os1348 family NHLP clan protein [Chloroflexota bacterium]|nr:Os1348 family NHLP clan protein [Chloroflexota bacterium]